MKTLFGGIGRDPTVNRASAEAERIRVDHGADTVLVVIVRSSTDGKQRYYYGHTELEDEQLLHIVADLHERLHS